MAGPTATEERPNRRWLARLSLAAGLAAVILLLSVGVARTIVLLLVVLASLVVLIVGAWLVVAHRGALRALGAVLTVGSLTTVFVALARRDLLWAALLATGLLIGAFAAGQAALAPVPAARPRESTAPPAKHPFLIVNPRSGGGKARKAGLQAAAEQMGVEVAVLDGPDFVDVAELARTAITAGADLVGVAGGDGTQALVAAVAAEKDVPMFVVPAGTRNHFALDLGLDRDDVLGSLQALTDGVEMRVDLGDVEGRPFVNNVSFGAYAAIVEREDYRDDKLNVTLRVLPDMLTGQEGPRLTAQVDDLTLEDPQAVLVSNNRYGTGDIAGGGRRLCLDGGVLGVIGVQISNVRTATGLLRGLRSRAITTRTAEAVVVDSDTGTVPAGVDGESVLLPAPVHCHVRPGALRVRVPQQRPGVPPMHEPVSLGALTRLSGPRRKTKARAT